MVQPVLSGIFCESLLTHADILLPINALEFYKLSGHIYMRASVCYIWQLFPWCSRIIVFAVCKVVWWQYMLIGRRNQRLQITQRGKCNTQLHQMWIKRSWQKILSNTIHKHAQAKPESEARVVLYILYNLLFLSIFFSVYLYAIQFFIACLDKNLSNKICKPCFIKCKNHQLS